MLPQEQFENYMLRLILVLVVANCQLYSFKLCGLSEILSFSCIKYHKVSYIIMHIPTYIINIRDLILAIDCMKLQQSK